MKILKILFLINLLISFGCTHENCVQNPDLFFEDKKCETDCLDKFIVDERFEGTYEKNGSNIQETFNIKIESYDSLQFLLLEIGKFDQIDNPYAFVRFIVLCELTDCDELDCNNLIFGQDLEHIATISGKYKKKEIRLDLTINENPYFVQSDIQIELTPEE